ncbi:MAG TPA: HDOD domain-containing protein [Ilumatobacteraceae bacterium]|nr:HDOD domain-containing protein [Ilumatobacteraceae bacterium]
MTKSSLVDELGTLFVGRQPILDRALETIGYELLFRDGVEVGSADFVDGDVATARVLMNAITEIGLDALVGNTRAFVNLTARFVAQPELLASVPRDRVVLEILEYVEPTQAVRDGLASLVAQGFWIALDDFAYRPRLAPLLDLARIVKYDFALTRGDTLRQRIENDHAAGRLVVVERIENRADHREAEAAGADYFQGFFFARPSVMAARGVPANKITLLQLLARVNDPDSTLTDIVEILATDVAMSVKALRFVNSAAAGLTTKVESIQQASVLLGRDTLRSWTSLTLMSALDDKPAELVSLALSRAKFCELLARHEGGSNPATYYAVGMLSLLDVMFDTKMHLIVDQLPLDDSIRAALLGAEGPITDVLRLAIAVEDTDLSSYHPEPHVADAHYQAIVWTTQLLKSAVTG